VWLSTARRRDVSGRLSYLPRPTYLPTHQPYLPHLPHPPTPARCEEPRRTKKSGRVSSAETGTGQTRLAARRVLETHCASCPPCLANPPGRGPNGWDTQQAVRQGSGVFDIVELWPKTA